MSAVLRDVNPNTAHNPRHFVIRRQVQKIARNLAASPHLSSEAQRRAVSSYEQGDSAFRAIRRAETWLLESIAPQIKPETTL